MKRVRYSESIASLQKFISVEFISGNLQDVRAASTLSRSLYSNFDEPISTVAFLFIYLFFVFAVRNGNVGYFVTVLGRKEEREMTKIKSRQGVGK